WLKASRKITESGYVFTNHPAYNYLAKDYGFKVKNFDVSPGENFTKKEIATLKKGVQHHKGTFFWWESAPSESQEKFIKEVLRLENKVVSPSEVQGGKDFYETMRQNVSQF
ncbi:MAG: metal ABC transporter solute-binding protein, Zn/Mn family, partial [Bacteriovoracaceae bacterium]